MVKLTILSGTTSFRVGWNYREVAKIFVIISPAFPSKSVPDNHSKHHLPGHLILCSCLHLTDRVVSFLNFYLLYQFLTVFPPD